MSLRLPPVVITLDKAMRNAALLAVFATKLWKKTEEFLRRYKRFCDKALAINSFHKHLRFIST